MSRVMQIIEVNREIEFRELHRQTYQDIDKFTLEKLIESLISMEFVEVRFEGKVKIIKYIGKNTF
jgi:hypothetical protein